MEGPLNLFHDAHAASNWETASKLSGYGQRRSRRCQWDVDSLERGSNVYLDKSTSKCQQNILDDPIGKAHDLELGHGPYCNADHNVDVSNGLNVGEASNRSRKHLMGDDFAFLRESSPSNDITCLTLKLAGNADFMMEEENGSNNGKGRRLASPSGQFVMCQVDDCQADLSAAKDYHRRHKVCEMHAKAVEAPIGGFMQRFCQQCSRFHLLEEFDDGKRSCRWRLAGHNKRRRKSQSDSMTLSACTLSEDESRRAAGIVGLINFLREQKCSSPSTEMVNNAGGLLQFISQGNSVSEEQNDASMGKGLNLGQGHADLKLLAGAAGDTQLLAKLASISPEVLLLLLERTKNKKTPDQRRELKVPIPQISGVATSSTVLGQTSQSEKIPGQACQSEKIPGQSIEECALSLLPSAMLDKQCMIPDSNQVSLHASVSSLNTFPIISSKLTERSVPDTDKLPQTSAEHRNLTCCNMSNISALSHNSNANNNDPSTVTFLQHKASPVHGVGSCHLRPIIDLQKLPSEQTSEMLESNSDQSPASSEEDWQDSTGRIWFKLIDRSPSEIPQAIRGQILEWLSYYPTNIESYLRPGCVILTVFLSMLVHAWTELIKDLHLSLKRLIQTGNDDFWRKGRIIVQIGWANAFIIDGEVHVNEPFKLGSLPQVVAIHPLAVVAGEETELLLKGYNLCTPGTSIVCAYNGKYEVQEVLSFKQLSEFPPKFDQDMELMQEVSFNFKGGASNNIGRCFVQVEQNTVTGDFIPIIVADKDICAEICTLESEIQNYTLDASRQQYDAGMESRNFLNELGWLFQWSFLEISCSVPEIVTATHVSPHRFKRLLIYVVERNWCAVLKKLLDIFFVSGLGPIESLVDVELLHRAVQCKCRLIVDMLLAYDAPLNNQSGLETPDTGNTTNYESLHRRVIFRPDMSGPAGITPLHLAATMQDADDIVDSLTNDSTQVGLHSWYNARDSTGQTPLAYALERGHQSYIHLVYAKLGRKDALRSTIINIDDSSLSMESQIVFPSSTMEIESDEKNAPQFGLESCTMKSPARVACPPSRMLAEVRAMPSQSCRDCHGPAFIMATNRISGLRGSAFRPFLFSMIAVATLCVCVCLVFKSGPSILFVTTPFMWKSVSWGYL